MTARGASAGACVKEIDTTPRVLGGSPLLCRCKWVDVGSTSQVATLARHLRVAERLPNVALRCAAYDATSPAQRDGASRLGGGRPNLAGLGQVTAGR